jgi:hypothetical protein
MSAQIKIVHTELYAYAARLAYLQKRTTQFAKATMAKVVAFAIEKKIASSQYEAYKLARPVVSAIMAITPAETDYYKFVGNPVTQHYQDLADRAARGDIELQLTPFDWWCRFFLTALNGCLKTITATVMFMLSLQAPWSAASWLGIMGTIVFAVLMAIDLRHKYRLRSSRQIAEK